MLCDPDTREYLINYARSLIYTTALGFPFLAAIRTAAAKPETATMAPGDREWQVEQERARVGIPIDAETAGFLGLDTTTA